MTKPEILYMTIGYNPKEQEVLEDTSTHYMAEEEWDTLDKVVKNEIDYFEDTDEHEIYVFQLVKIIRPRQVIIKSEVIDINLNEIITEKLVEELPEEFV
jgi:hypothetical protein